MGRELLSGGGRPLLSMTVAAMLPAAVVQALPACHAARRARVEKRPAGVKRAAAELPWGKPVEGVQVRLIPSNRVWKLGETPVLKYGIRNRGKRDFRVWLDECGRPACELLVNGKRYAAMPDLAHPPNWDPIVLPPPLRLGPGKQHERDLSLTGDWRCTEDGKPLELAPGKHKISLSVGLSDAKVWQEELLMVPSNQVMIEVLSAPRRGAAA